MTRYFIITKKANRSQINVDTIVKDADEVRKHHFNDGFDLYVSTYATDSEGYLWLGPHQGTAHIRGISVTSKDTNTIDWFVRTWVELGYLESVIPCDL